MTPWDESTTATGIALSGDQTAGQQLLDRMLCHRTATGR